MRRHSISFQSWMLAPPPPPSPISPGLGTLFIATFMYDVATGCAQRHAQEKRRGDKSRGDDCRHASRRRTSWVGVQFGGGHLILDSVGLLRVVERREGLVDGEHGRRERGDDHRLAPPAERLLQQPSQLRVAVRDAHLRGARPRGRRGLLKRSGGAGRMGGVQLFFGGGAPARRPASSPCTP